MKISDINQHNYTMIRKLFSETNQKAAKTSLSQLLSELPQSAPQGCGVNPYANPGQDITGRTDWKKIVPVSQEVTDKLLANVKENFEERNGMTGEHNNQNNIINDYLQTLPPEERPSASWTLNQIIINEANRYVNKIRQHDPYWTNGQPFDTSILDDDPAENHLNQKV